MVLDPLDIGALSHSMHGQTANYPRHHADIPRSANSELYHSSHRGSRLPQVYGASSSLPRGKRQSAICPKAQKESSRKVARRRRPEEDGIPEGLYITKALSRSL